MKKTGTLLPLLFAASTYAHGILTSMTINGKSYMGNGLSGNGGTTIDSIIRQVSAQDPVKGASNTALSCGTNSQPATLIASVNPGDELGFSWKGAGGGNVCIFIFYLSTTDLLIVASQYRPDAYIPSLMRLNNKRQV